jgi:hypothetical protein
MKKVMVVAVILAVVVGLGWTQDFQSRGYQLQSTSKEGIYTVYQLVDGRGNAFTLAAAKPITASQIDLLNSVRDKFSAFKALQIASVRIVFSDSKADIIVVPRAYVYKDVDFAKYLPSGLQFSYTDYLEYDFRMAVDNMFIRVSGQFFTEDQLSDKLLSVVQNPGAYIQSQDPEYILRKFKEIDKVTDLLKADTAALKDENTALKAALKDETSALKAKLDASDKAFQALKTEYELFKYAVMVFNDKGWFGAVNIPPKDGIARLLALKKADPSLTQKDAALKLQAEGIVMSQNEIFLVYGAYFNEFK